MRDRLRTYGYRVSVVAYRVWYALRALGRLVVAVLSEQRLDLVVVTGLALWMCAWWAVARPLALAIPAAVLVWYGLPPRPPFIARPRASRRPGIDDIQKDRT